jgi:hypothetical protein
MKTRTDRHGKKLCEVCGVAAPMRTVTGCQPSDILTESELLPAVEVVTVLSVLCTRNTLSHEESQAIARCIHLLRTHALPMDHPWALG